MYVVYTCIQAGHVAVFIATISNVIMIMEVCSMRHKLKRLAGHNQRSRQYPCMHRLCHVLMCSIQQASAQYGLVGNRQCLHCQRSRICHPVLIVRGSSKWELLGRSNSP